MALRGVTVYELLGLPSEAEVWFPEEVRRFIEALAFFDLRSTTSEHAFVHRGTVRSLGEVTGLPLLSGNTVEIPGLNTGLKFQLFNRRRSAATGDHQLEPEPLEFNLDLIVDRLAIATGWTPAKLVSSDSPPLRVRHLEEDQSKTAEDKPRRVAIVGSGILRISHTPDAGHTVRLIDASDALDADAPTGPVARLSVSPPHFIARGIGFTVEELIIDDSSTYTPAEIAKHNQADDWRGLYITRAAVYPPRAPLVPNLSAGVRELLLGTPFGLQGELDLAWGIDAEASPQLTIELQPRTGGATVANHYDTRSRQIDVTIPIDPAGAAWRARGFLENGKQASWSLPDVPPPAARGQSSRFFDVTPGTQLGFRPLAPNGDPTAAAAEFPDVMVRFVAASPSTVPAMPRFQVKWRPPSGPERVWNDVVHISGDPAALQDLEIHVTGATSDPQKVKLEVAGERLALDRYVTLWRDKGHSSTPVLAEKRLTVRAGVSHDLILVDPDNAKRRRRLRVETLEKGALILGTATGAFDRDNVAVPLRAVEATYQLADFNASGILSPSTDDVAGSSAVLPVLADRLIVATAALGKPEDPDASPAPLPPPSPVNYLKLINFEYNQANPATSQEFANLKNHVERILNPPSGTVSNLAWVVIGRTDDIGSKPYNADLGLRRASSVAELLLQHPTPADRIYFRSEQSTSWETASATDRDAVLTKIDALYPTLKVKKGTWLIKETEGFDEAWPDRRASEQEGVRGGFRRADVFSIYDVLPPTPPPIVHEEQELDVALRRVLLHGADPANLVMPPVRDAKMPYVGSLRFKWDSATLERICDWLPTLAELELAWEESRVPLRDSGGNALRLNGSDVPDATLPALGFLARWNYDARTKEMLVSATLSRTGAADGLIPLVVGANGAPASDVVSRVLATAFALGPALASGVESDDVSGTAVNLAALLAASLAASAWSTTGRVIVQSVTAEYVRKIEPGSAQRKVRLLCEYTVDIGFKVDALDFRTDANYPLRIRYKNVGVVIDVEQVPPKLDDFHLVFDDASFAVEDPGRWQIGGALGKLLRVTAARVGTGSAWAEVDLAFAIDLGVVKITDATIRTTFDGGVPRVELRGLGAAVKVPRVFDATGKLVVGSDGAVRAALDVTVLPDAPSPIRGKGDLVWDPDTGFTQIGLATSFATPLPLAGTPLGLYGLAGRFVSHGKRKMGPNADPIQREIDWYRAPENDKYVAQRDQWAFGLGALVGTIPDGGFSFNAMGMLAVQTPDPSVVFTIDATFLQKPTLPAKETGEERGASIEVLGIIAIDSSAVTVAMAGSYNLPKLLSIDVPVGGYFPISGNSYLRIGSDGFSGRSGSPVTVKLLPDSLDVDARFFFMVESGGIENLGGHDLDLPNFAVGAGLTFSLDWDAVVVSISGSATFVAGVGSNPLTLAGFAKAQGEITILGVGVSLSGAIEFLVVGNDSWIVHAEICGELDLWLTTVKRCLRKTYRHGPDPALLPPPSPILSCDLTDRLSHVLASAKAIAPPTPPGTVPPASPPLGSSQAHLPVVWPDVVLVLHFAHYALPATPAGSTFDVRVPPAGDIWSGSEELKFAFRLIYLTLRKLDGTAVPAPAAATWVLSPAGDGDARDLQLLSWEPARWARSLGDGGATAPVDPAGTLGDACKRLPEAQPSCALGLSGKRRALDKVDFFVARTPGVAYSSSFHVHAVESLPGMSLHELVDLAADVGLAVMPGRALTLGGPVPGVSNAESAWRLPALEAGGLFVASTSLEGRFAADLIAPSISLVLERAADEKCDSYSGVSLGSRSNPWAHRGFNYGADVDGGGLSIVDRLPLGAPDTVPELQFDAMTVALPFVAQEVMLELALFTDRVDLEARDAQGQLLATLAVTGAAGVLQTVELRALAISRVTLRAHFRPNQERHGVLKKICARRLQPVAYDRRLLGSVLDAAEAAGTQPPQVELQNTAGTWVPATATLAGRVSSTAKQPVYQYTIGNGVYRRMRVAASRYYRVSLLAVCAVDVDTALERAQDEATRNQVINDWNGSGGPRRTLLQANTTYELIARCQYAQWRKSEDKPKPSFTGATWQDYGYQTFQFKTAALALDQPYEEHDQSVFDPAWLRRYLLGLEPSGQGAPHFTQDPVRAWFSVDYIDELLRKYGRRLLLKLRRTDPAPGTQPPSVPAVHSWVALPIHLKELGDLRLSQAALNVPCLNDKAPLGGASASASFTLERHARYDLLVCAPALGVSDTSRESERVVVARTQFETSRYTDPVELLRALGFGSMMEPPLPVPPYDLVSSGSLPAGARPGHDRALDEALVALGLDPLPLPTAGPRTYLVWSAGPPWKLVAVLLDGDESLERPIGTPVAADDPLVHGARLRVVNARTSGSHFNLYRSNASGSRVLLLPDSGPVALPGRVVLMLNMHADDPSANLAGQRWIDAGPSFLNPEGA